MKPANEENPWEILSSEIVHQTPWVRINHHKVINPGGSESVYSVTEFKNLAIGILPFDDEYNTWIVGQYRFPINTYSWEIPEGGGDPNIPPIESAKRELEEECGLVADEWQELLISHTSNSATNEIAYIYVAKGLTHTAPNPDEDERLEIRKLPFTELYRMVMDNKITDSLTVMAVLKAKILMDKGAL
jgi:8-oxo-dGTP pyrophosphatase MutT (NUDIX family)